jgi:hypothetical protein
MPPKLQNSFAAESSRQAHLQKLEENGVKFQVKTL